MKKKWLVMIFAASMLPGCMVAANSANTLDCQHRYEDSEYFLDDFDGLFEFIDGYYGYNYGNGPEEDPLLDSFFPGIGQEMDELD